MAHATSNAADEDAAMLARIAAGEERAFTMYVSRHLERVHAIALRYTGKPDDAQDIAQETFLRVWRGAAKFVAGEASPNAWLSRIAINLCHDWHRAKRRRAWLPFADHFDPPSPEPGPEQIAADRAELGAVREAIAELPERQRSALILTVLAGHSTKEASGILGISPGAVEQAVFRARSALRAQFADEDG